MLMLSRPYKCIEVDVVLVVLFVGSFFLFGCWFFWHQISANTVTAALKKLAETCFTNLSIKPI